MTTTFAGSTRKWARMSSRIFPETAIRSEEHTSELQSQSNLVCRLLLEKKTAVQTATRRVETASRLVNYLRARPRDFSPALLYRHIQSLTIPATTYVTAQRVRRIICREFDEALERVHLILTPTTPIPAPTIEECQRGYLEVDGKRVALQGLSGSFGTTCTIPFNVTGLPAISVCGGFSSLGLPIGLQIVGGAFREG